RNPARCSMKRIRLSIGSWAYCFGPYKDNPVPFDTVIDKLGSLGFDGVELGGFPPHPHPAQFDTKAKRAELKQKVSDRGLEFSGLAADLWSCPIVPLPDNSKWMSAFEQNLEFARDLGIDCIRVDSVSPPDVFEKQKIDHVHLIDSDNTLHNNETSTHAPFGQGVLNFDALIPALLRSGAPTNWWTIDLCFWPNAWEVTADAKVFLDRMAQKYVNQKSEARS